MSKHPDMDPSSVELSAGELSAMRDALLIAIQSQKQDWNDSAFQPWWKNAVSALHKLDMAMEKRAKQLMAEGSSA